MENLLVYGPPDEENFFPHMVCLGFPMALVRARKLNKIKPLVGIGLHALV